MINVTKKIKELLKSFPEDKKKSILKSAWDACCDGAYLAKEYPDLDYDPWDTGDHEKVEEIELDAVIASINNYVDEDDDDWF